MVISCPLSKVILTKRVKQAEKNLELCFKAENVGRVFAVYSFWKQ